ncbi:MAG: UDP-N-acetylmuramoyl-L-alanyl-D-glutamate--2,6-diaminopimelate ligase [Senegalia sp. (in: firmicutes)]|uniref:UDP-N-acetylmuramoyl-L-alanyl-D-glutamate--2, 6-diaminopimelate ligase n=1 Tax=Senegalia sp. (in: firmicutes) TaxID=1924098 RepID=UPI003F9D2FAF
MILNYILSNVSYEKVVGEINKDIKGIDFDSRNIKEDFIFVAITGFKVDGHDFINTAIKNGARTIIVEKDVKVDDEITLVKVADSRVALAEVSSAFYEYPTKDLNMIGITGTNGKTSISYIIDSILKEVKHKTGIVGTLGVVIDEKNIKTNNTTPESLHLQNFFEQMRDENVDDCIMEVSSHSISLNRVDMIDFNIGIFTNLSEDHLDFHNTLEEYMNEKTKLFYKTSDVNIINNEDKYGKALIKKLEKDRDIKLLTYGIDSGDIRACQIEQSVNGIKYNMITPKGNININLPLPGKFNLYNALAAAACALHMNISLDVIKKGLEGLKGVKGRFELVELDKDFDIIIDFAHSPDGFENVLNTVKQFAKSRIITVFGCGGDRDKNKRPQMGKIASKYSDICLVTSDNSRSEKTEDIIEDIVVGIDNHTCEYFKIPDRRDAIKKAIQIAKSDDIIMLLGKGHETYQIIDGKTYDFDEVEIIKEIIN